MAKAEETFDADEFCSNNKLTWSHIYITGSFMHNYVHSSDK